MGEFTDSVFPCFETCEFCGKSREETGDDYKDGWICSACGVFNEEGFSLEGQASEIPEALSLDGVALLFS